MPAAPKTYHRAAAVGARVEAGWRTRAGARHGVEGRPNEDRVLVREHSGPYEVVFALADGMGGHARPAEAAEAAVHAAVTRIDAAEDGPVAAALDEAVRAAGEAVARLARGDGAPPGTTLMAGVVAGARLEARLIGDGSAYLWRGGRARALGGGESERSGSRPREFLAANQTPAAVELCLDLEPDDVVLFCTDGLTRCLGSDGRRLTEIMRRGRPDAGGLAAQIVAEARPEEYEDDTTVVVIKALPVEVTPAPPRRQRPRRRGSLPILAGLTAALLLGGLAGWHTGRRSAAPAPPARPVERPRLPAIPPGWPNGTTVLVERDSGRHWVTVEMRPRPGDRNGEGATRELTAVRIGPDGRATRSGRWRLDERARILEAPDGRRLPVDLVPGQSVLWPAADGLLSVPGPIGAPVLVNGEPRGIAPLTLRLAAGPHQVIVQARGGRRRETVTVLPGVTVTLPEARR